MDCFISSLGPKYFIVVILFWGNTSYRTEEPTLNVAASRINMKTVPFHNVLQ